MTAIAQRRTRRTKGVAVAAMVLSLLALTLVVVGVTTLWNSQAGETVGVDERPRVALPSTPNAMLAVTDDEGTLTSLVVLTLLPEGQGGSIVTIPVNADASAGFGLQRRPLDELFDPADPDGLVMSVEEMLSITIERSSVVDPAGLAALLEPIGSVQVVLPDAVIDADAAEATSDPDDPDDTATTTTTSPDDATTDSVPEEPEAVVGENGVIVTAGPQILDTAGIVDVLTAVDSGVAVYDQHPLDVAMWEAIAATAPVTVPPPPVTTDATGAPVPPATFDELWRSLFDGEVGVRDIPAFEPAEGTNPTGVDVVVLDRADAALVFAQISPGLVSTPNAGSTMRIVVPYTDEQLAVVGELYATNSDLAREMVGRLLFLGANIVSVDTAPTGAEELTVVEVVDPRLLDETVEASEILFGPSEVRLAETVIEGVDIVVTLGTAFLDKELAAYTGDAGLEPDSSVAPTTVGTDG